MQRRPFLIRLTQALAAFGALPAVANARLLVDKATKIHLQDCRIAGSHYYDCPEVLPNLRVGDALQFRRQSGNPHDERAIEILWRDRKLGYLPRLDNAAAASLLDRTHDLRGEILAVDDPMKNGSRSACAFGFTPAPATHGECHNAREPHFKHVAAYQAA